MNNYKSKEFLYQKYINEKLTTKQISDLTGIPFRTIHSWLVKFNIPRRKGGVEHWSEEQKELRRKWNRDHPEINRMKGKKHSRRTRKLMSIQRQKHKNANWKGNCAKKKAAGERARRWFKEKQPCETCGDSNTHRHHIDGNPYNNSPSNIQWLCPLHHRRKHLQGGVSSNAHA